MKFLWSTLALIWLCVWGQIWTGSISYSLLSTTIDEIQRRIRWIFLFFMILLLNNFSEYCYWYDFCDWTLSKIWTISNVSHVLFSTIFFFCKIYVKFDSSPITAPFVQWFFSISSIDLFSVVNRVYVNALHLWLALIKCLFVCEKLQELNRIN